MHSTHSCFLHFQFIFFSHIYLYLKCFFFFKRCPHYSANDEVGACNEVVNTLGGKDDM